MNYRRVRTLAKKHDTNPMTERGIYDLYLSAIKSAQSDWRVLQMIEELSHAFDTRVLSECLLNAESGFLGLNLPLDQAYRLHLRLEEVNVPTIVLPTRYRAPRVSLDEARGIAEVYFQRQIAESPELRSYHFQPTRLSEVHSSLMYWTFTTTCPKWQEQELIPGLMFASVDRVDGHLWEPYEHFDVMTDLEQRARRLLGAEPKKSSREEISPERKRTLRQRRF